MLSTIEIIVLYTNQEYDMIIDKLQLELDNYTIHQRILQYGIDNDNIELISSMFLTENLHKIIPTLYPILEIALETDFTFHTKMKMVLMSSVNTMYLPEEQYIQFIHFICRHFRCDPLINMIIRIAIGLNYVNVIGILFTHSFNIEKIFDNIMNTQIATSRKIKLDTFIFLENHGIDILIRIKQISLIMLYTNDIPGLIYCINNGVDVNYMLHNMYFNITIETLKYLLENGADLQKLDLPMIKQLICGENDNLNIIAYLIDNGVDMHNYINELLLVCINRNCINIMKYLLPLGSDIHFENDLLLFYSANLGKIKFVELLVEFGFHNDDILLFVEMDLFKYFKMYPEIQVSYNDKNRLEIAKILIKNGINLTNPRYVCCLYLVCAEWWNYNEELFIYFLDYNFDLNIPIKLNTAICEVYILEVAVLHSANLTKLCLQYGADPYINNHSPLHKAIEYNKLDIVRILLDLGSVVNLDSNYEITPDMVNLFAEYQIEYKIKKID